MNLFLVTSACLTIGLPPLVIAMHQQGWISGMPSLLYESTWLTAFTTTVLFIYLYRSRKGSHFVHLYLLSMVVKLVAFLIYSALIILHDRSGALMNVVYLLIVYSVFTATEIGFLYRSVSRHSGS